ncbi:hypothetical protein ACMHYJ_16575 [Castellaniella hirudinis]|uniref:hypothetical protein n=1 Tax=Castellaniella hirudinis TaxID=1144617 RepID=UPI0039C44AF4
MSWPGSSHATRRLTGGRPWAPPASSNPRRWRLGLAALAWLCLLSPPLRHALESDMAPHMLIQLPLLAGCGWLLAAAIPAPVRARIAPWNQQGISGLLLASLVMMLWMLPAALDAALDQPWMTAAKFAGIPLLLGLPCALSWPQAGFIARGVFLAEFVATLFRTGWLYWVSPTRLCANYLLDAQKTTGIGLLAAGAVLLALLLGGLIWGGGRPPTAPADRGNPAGPEDPGS